jgi:serine/threonine protein kinase
MCPSAEQLRAFRAALLPDALRQEVSDHLRGCTQCSAQLENLPAAPGTGSAYLLVPTIEQSLAHDFVPRVTPPPLQGRVETPAPGTRYCGPPKDESGKAEYPFLLPPQQPEEIGRLGNYRVLRLLGKGGMGFVFRAEDLALLRPVALKVMNPQVHGAGEGGQRFLREARIMAAIKHEHLVTVYQAGQEGEVCYLAMELLEGESLGDFLHRAGPCGAAEVLRLGRETAQGLAEVHGHGLIHRDIKPSNIWLEAPGGRVKILDFGLARFVHEDARLTRSGAVIGTPSFMSPEQARGAALDARSDLFSLGCVLYCLCIGRPPFEADTVMGVLTALAVDHPRPVHELNHALPRELGELVMQLLAKNPHDRPASAQVVVKRLGEIEARLSGRGPAPAPSSATALLTTASAEKPAAKKSVVRRGAEAVLVAVLTMSVATTAVQLAPLLAPKNPAKAPQTARVDPTPSVHLPAPDSPVTSAKPEQPPAGPAFTEKTSTSKEKAAEVKPQAPRPEPPVSDKSAKPKDKVVAAAPPPPPVEEEIVYLKDLVPTAKEHWPFTPPADHGPNGRPMPPGGPPSLEVIVQGKNFPHGLFMHPPAPPFEGQAASLSYRLPKPFTRFKAVVSLNDGPERATTPVTFYVYGDGNSIPLWTSKPVSTQKDAQPVDISIRGKAVLKLQVRCPGESRGVHAVWIDPRVSKQP